MLKKVGGTFKIKDTVRVTDGKAVLGVKVPKKGRYKVKVAYLGEAHTLRGKDKTNLRVR